MKVVHQYSSNCDNWIRIFPEKNKHKLDRVQNSAELEKN